METYIKSLHIFSSKVECWQALKKACSKHFPYKLLVTSIASQLTIDFKTIVKTFKLAPSSLT
jgi:hypothetical protein